MVNMGLSLDSVKVNLLLIVGNYNELVEVKLVSGNIIIFYNNWFGSIGIILVIIKFSVVVVVLVGVVV